MMKRSSGILMPISSLSSPYGIGTLGRGAREFIDFLHKAGQRYWQILPIGPTGFGDSPYQSFSVFAGNPYFIDLETLCEEGLLSKEECEGFDWGQEANRVDYGKLFASRFVILERAFQRIGQAEKEELEEFTRENRSWIEDYALYMAVKEKMDLRAWREWEEEIRLRRPSAMKKYKQELQSRVQFYAWMQCVFFRQWGVLREYARRKGVRLIGDVPIYVAEDSADTWGNTQLFSYDEHSQPLEVAGCPPDFFSKTGQLWGNPLYRWDKMKQEGYRWWIARIRATSKLFDLTRIDHFRGFASYYAIPAGDKTAEHGQWKEGPGIALFEKIKQELGSVALIAEDLGVITEDVVRLREETGYPGMKILEFAFDSDAKNEYLPHNCIPNSVIYLGTHDNDTAKGWAKSLAYPAFHRVQEYLNCHDPYEIHWDLIRAAWGSVCNLAVAQMQDFLGLGSEARTNHPSTLGGNWAWRSLPGELTPELAERIAALTKLYGRTNDPIPLTCRRMRRRRRNGTRFFK